ncbi:hypothetical protein BD410DRAFT_806272 [Rickenella mellea]|uniref:WW domain-containing protein n=1 Tax=Rickenella mellea TaxID=50990 RepID=A0A4Y7PUK0_9AGAM|nr:hypothetical protein BD410DRAFT_806272 [Rickenella mellea]
MDDTSISKFSSLLRPTTAQWSQRYERTCTAQPSHKLIPAASFTSYEKQKSIALPPNWSSHIQSEGQLYFYNRTTRIVTEANLHDLSTLECICRWSLVLEHMVRARKIHLPEQFEIFLELEEGGGDGCNYYLVDHEARTEFWLEDVNSEQFFAQTISFENLRWSLAEDYWHHVSYFPAHFGGIPMTTVRELCGVLSHSYMGMQTKLSVHGLTSQVSTHAFNSADSARLLEVIRTYISNSHDQEKITDSNMICGIARIWSNIVFMRFLHLYGEPVCRLSRNQAILHPPKRIPFAMKVIFSGFFGEPQTFLTSLDELWTDKVVNAEAWIKFMAVCQREWRDATLWTIGLTIAHAILVVSSIGMRSVSVAGMIASAAGLVASISLTTSHRDFESGNSDAFHDYLSRFDDVKFGLQPLAVLFSLPKAMLMWSCALFALQACLAEFQLIDSLFAACAVGALITYICAMIYVLRRRSGTTLDSDIPTPIWRSMLGLSGKKNQDVERVLLNEKYTTF